jgi:hypothetical protein
LKRLGNCTALWVGLQRQVMVHGWSFGELGQLDKLDVVATVELLSALNVRPPRGFEDDSEDDLERLIIDAHKHIGAVKSDAVKAARRSGIDLPAPNPYMIGSWVEDSVVVDRALRSSTRSDSGSLNSWPAGLAEVRRREPGAVADGDRRRRHDRWICRRDGPAHPRGLE